MKTFWRWLIVIVAVIGLALALKAGLVAFAGYVILGVLLLSRFLAKSWITNLEAEREVPEGQREIGDTVPVEVKLTNTGKVPIGWLLFEDMLPEFAFRARPARISIKGGRIKVLFIPAGKTKTVKYKMTFNARGYYQIGPSFAETGDVFGLHRRHRILTEPKFVLVLPKIVPLAKYQFASERPIGEIRLANRLFEDPTRTAGVRQYQVGDPLSRIHWRATARTGQLHCRVFEPTSLAGASILVDFFAAGYDKNREPYRSDLAVTTACSLAYAVSLLNQQVGFASNGRDAAERIKTEASEKLEQPDEGFTNRAEAREDFEALDQTDRLRPVVVPTRRGFDQFQQIRESLARLELTDGMTFPRLIVEVAPRLPKDATVIAVLPAVPVDSAIALGQLRKQGFAISAVLISIADDDKPLCAGRLMAEGIRDVRFVQTEEELHNLGEKTQAGPSMYEFAGWLVNSIPMPSRLLAFAQLVRLPNVFTAFADILLAACVVGLFVQPVTLALLLAASGCLYLSGMAWNDFFDRHDDAKTRPTRPLPSGRIRPRTAALVAAGLMLAGIAFAVFAGWPGYTVGIVAVGLAGMIVLYDAVLKHYWVGPVGMGACRFLNVLMGCLAAPPEVLDKQGLVPVHVAGVVGLYIVGVTWFARTEEGTSKRWSLIGATAVMALALASAVSLPLHSEPGHTPWYYLYVLLAFGFVVGWPVVAAIHTPSAKNVQAAVKRCILGLVLLDAVLATAFVGWPALLMVLLLVPAVLLGKRVYST